MLHIHNLTIRHRKDLRVLVQDLTLILHPGEKLALIGEEGTGKSTLMQTMMYPDKLPAYVEVEGQVKRFFVNPAYLPQSLSEEQAQQTVADFIYSDIDYNRFDFALFYNYAEQFQLNIETMEKGQQRLSSLSGGEKIKLQLLKLLAYNPDVLLLDEPTSDLDMETVSWLEQFIRNTERTVIFISHDEAILSKTATAILHLELLKKRQEARHTYFKGSYTDYKRERKERFEKQLQVANKEREEHHQKMTENQRIQKRVEHQLRNTKSAPAGRLLAKKMHALQSQERRFEKEALYFTEIPQNMDAIHLFFSEITPPPAQKILLSWEKRQLATGQEVQLNITGHAKIVITGKNGIGKTLLLKEIKKQLEARTDLSIGYMPQDYDSLFSKDETALTFLAESGDSEKIRSMLASLQFTREEMTHSVTNLSGGQKAKLFLAKMVLSHHNVLLLDEPTRHFSPTSQPLIRQMLADFPGAMISISHDRAFIKEIGKTIYQLNAQTLKKV